MGVVVVCRRHSRRGCNHHSIVRPGFQRGVPHRHNRIGWGGGGGARRHRHILALSLSLPHSPPHAACKAKCLQSLQVTFPMGTWTLRHFGADVHSPPSFSLSDCLSFFLGWIFLWGLFFLGGVFFFLAFPWFFLGKTAVSLRFGRIWRDFPGLPYEKTCFLLFLGFS